MTNVAIRVDNLGKKYQLGTSRSGSFRESLSQMFRAKGGGQQEAVAGTTPGSPLPAPSSFWALKDINFEVKRGEAVGIIGRNGAGKSTLLKILSRITEPTTGRYEIFGRVSSLLEVGTGFHPELTGRENVYLNGTILGMKRREVKAKFDEIVAFSGVEKFIDTPVKHYSSGMQVRLAFAVAAHLEPEILIIDEVLAVGDAEFQKKCLGKMEDVTEEGRTVLFVSHNMGAVKMLCDRGMLLKKGCLVFDGAIDEIIDNYLGAETTNSQLFDFHSYAIQEEFVPKKAIIREKKSGKELSVYRSDNEIEILFSYYLNEAVRNIRVNMAILSSDEHILFTTTSHSIEPPRKEIGEYNCSFTIPKDLLNEGVFKVRLHAGIPGSKILLTPTVVGTFRVEKINTKSLYSIKLKGFISPNVDVQYI